MESRVRRILLALHLLASLVVATAERDLLQTKGNLVALVNGQYLVSSGDGNWAVPKLDSPGNIYPTVNSAYSVASPVSSGLGAAAIGNDVVRLGNNPTGINYIGRLEIFTPVNQSWATVCDDGWVENDPSGATATDPFGNTYVISKTTTQGTANLQVVCHQLGFPYAYTSNATAYYGSIARANPLATATALDEVACTAAQVAQQASSGTGDVSIVDCPNTNGVNGGFISWIPTMTNVPPGDNGCDENEELWICCPPEGVACPVGSQGLEFLPGIPIGQAGRRHLSSSDDVTSAPHGAARHLANHQGVDNSPWLPMKSGINAIASTTSRSNRGYLVLGGTSSGPDTPSLLLSNDNALTFMTVTGLPPYTASTAVAAGAIAAPLTTATLPYPAIQAPDINGIFFTPGGNGVGWAAGGINSLVHAAGGVGAILMTTNAGTVWKSVKIFPTPADIIAAYGVSGTAGAALYGRPFPGTLSSIMSTDSGTYVWAVGAPPNLITATSGSLTTLNTAGATLSISVASYPTILYSGNGGATWAMQTAPVLYTTTAYSLLSVYSATSHRAYAAGGCNDKRLPGGQFGTILYTMNGGFSWLQATYTGMTGKAPVFTHITFTPRTKIGWCVGWERPDEYYPLAYVAATSSAPAVAGVGYTVLISRDSGVTWQNAPVSSFPAGFVQTGANAGGPANLKHVFGTSWHTPQHGYMFGANFIYSTTNGGSTWVDETPNNVIVGANAGPVRFILAEIA